VSGKYAKEAHAVYGWEDVTAYTDKKHLIAFRAELS
jgi:hypothetical protein